MGDQIEAESSAMYCDNVVFVKSIDETRCEAEIEYFDINGKLTELKVNIDNLTPLGASDDTESLSDEVDEIDLTNLHTDLGISNERLNELLLLSDVVFESATKSIDAIKELCDQVDGYEKVYIGLMIGMSLENSRITNDLEGYLQEMTNRMEIAGLTDSIDPDDASYDEIMDEDFGDDPNGV